jgi:hypothetical protein
MGGQGGVEPEDLQRRPHTPAADERAAESEWGLPESFRVDVLQWCADHRITASEITYEHPQTLAGPVADVLRRWYRDRTERADRLVVPSFVLGDPWTSVDKALTPFWTFFPVRPALRAFGDYLDHAEPYRDIHIFAFEHGVMSEGIATPDEFCQTARDHGATPHLEAVRRSKFPHDIGSLAAYGDAFQRLPPASEPWRPLAVASALAGLRAGSGIAVVDHDVPESEAAR